MQQKRTYHRLERRILPIACPDPLCSTRLLLATMDQDCGSSFLLLHDSRRENERQCIWTLVCEVCSMPISDTAFH